MGKKRKRSKKQNGLVKCFFILLLIIGIIFVSKMIQQRENKVEGQEKVTASNAQIDKIAPNIKLRGEETIHLLLGGEYIEEGADATDDVDGDLSDSITIMGEIDTSQEGTYIKEYTVSDQAGNKVTVKRIIQVTKPSTTLKNGLPVLMYHFFYDKNEGSGQDNNWLEIHDFEEQMKYLSENNFYFPTWTEVEKYIDGKMTLPEKSIVITVDDGDDSFFELAVPVLQKYHTRATSFVITSWYGWRAANKEAYVDYQSHSDSMHEGTKGKGVILSWGHDKIVEDLKKSSDILGGATVFCYPFGHYNDAAKKAVKDAGYHLAFTIEGGRVHKGNDKYALPRVRISRGVSLNSFKTMVN